MPPRLPAARRTGDATLRHSINTVALAAASLLGGAVHAQAPQLPPPDAVTLDKLGYMKSFPPTADELSDSANRGTYPRARWTQQHVREFVPTRNVRRGALPAAPRNLDEIEFEDGAGQKTTISKWQQDNYTDALVVLHKGRMVYERYDNQMRPETPHLLFSVTKSFTGLLAAQLAREGRMELDALVNIYDFLKTLKKEGEHGTGIVYRTVHSEVLGWIVSRVTGKHFADLLSERIWTQLGIEEDAYVMVEFGGHAAPGRRPEPDRARPGALRRNAAPGRRIQRQAHLRQGCRRRPEKWRRPREVQGLGHGLPPRLLAPQPVVKTS